MKLKGGWICIRQGVSDTYVPRCQQAVSDWLDILNCSYVIDVFQRGKQREYVGRYFFEDIASLLIIRWKNALGVRRRHIVDIYIYVYIYIYIAILRIFPNAIWRNAQFSSIHIYCTCIYNIYTLVYIYWRLWIEYIYTIHI